MLCAVIVLGIYGLCFNRKVQILGLTSSPVGTMCHLFLGNDIPRLSSTLT